MAAIPSSALHELIKSLSRSEKRYFKVYSSKHTIGEENNYILLFDFLDLMEEYNEGLVFAHFNGHAFLNKFSITKKRLQDNIMRALDSFHANSSIDSQLYRMLHYAEILYNKSLYAQSRKYLNSAEKLAKKHGKQNILLEINQKTKRLLENTGYFGVDESLLSALKSADIQVAGQIEEHAVLWNIKSKLIWQLNKFGIARSEKDRAVFKLIYDELSHVKPRDCFESSFLVNQIHAAFFFSVANFSDALVYVSKNIELFQVHPDRLRNEVNVYFSLITNAIYLSNQLGDDMRVNSLLLELQQISNTLGDTSSDDMNIKLFSSIKSTKLMLFNGSGEFEKSVELVPLIEEAYRLYGDKINKSRKAYLNYNIAVAYFGLGQFSHALKWINTILNDNDFDEKQDVFCFAQLLNLIIHLELNNRELLPYAIKNTQRYLKSRDRAYKFEELFLKYLNKLSKAASPLDRLDLLENLLQDIRPLSEDPYERIVFDSFKFMLWAESKIKKVNFSELIKQDYSERSK